MKHIQPEVGGSVWSWQRFAVPELPPELRAERRAFPLPGTLYEPDNVASLAAISLISGRYASSRLAYSVFSTLQSCNILWLSIEVRISMSGSSEYVSYLQ